MSSGEQRQARVSGDSHGNSEYYDHEFLEAIEELEDATRHEIADKVGCSYQNTYFRLHDLRERGKVKTEPLEGTNAEGWYLVEA